MKKLLAILVAMSFVSFTACKNAPKTEECAVVEEVVLVEEGEEEGEIIEELVETPAK